MNRTEAMAAVEAILFTMGEAVEVRQIAQVLSVSEEETEKILALLSEKYRLPSSGLVLRRLENAVQISTKDSQFDNLVKIASAPKRYSLTDPMMETLSIVAYKQPVTRLEIESIRGVNSDHAINRLIEYDLIRELGRKDAPGRPLLFGTTEQFLRSFGVEGLADLPSLNTVQMEEIAEEAEEEVNTRLNI